MKKKKFRLLVTLIVVVMSLATACAAEKVNTNINTTQNEARTYSDQQELISTGVGTKFIIELKSSRRSEEYMWDATEFNSGLLKVIDTQTGDTDRFTFQTIAKGQTTINMRYSKADEGGLDIIENQVFTVKVE